MKGYAIPAKALLFGEYAVLQNFPAIAVTFSSSHFSMSIEICSQSDKNEIKIKSSFFPNKFLSFSLNAPTTKENEFFYKLLQPWQKLLLNHDLFIDISQSFAPSLGFGSSSAIITGVSLALYEYFFKTKEVLIDEVFWQFVRNSIASIQGSGSGYDAGVQLAAVVNLTSAPSCWTFQNQEISSTPVIQKLNIPSHLLKEYGCFLKTHLYSDTAKALTKFASSNEKIYLSKMHGELSLQFLQDYSIDNLKKLMFKSQIIAKEQGLFPTHSQFQNLVLRLKDVPFKSMGAGLGDCLWVLCKKKELQVKHGFLESDIAFAFEDIKDTYL